MRIIAIAITLILLSSCTFPGFIVKNYEENPFLEAYELTSPAGSEKVAEANRKKIDADEVSFIAITDVHIHREKDTSGIVRYDENFFSYAKSKNYDFMVNLGDLTDDGIYDSETESFIKKSIEATDNGWLLYCIGNHDRRIMDSPMWKDGVLYTQDGDSLNLTGFASMARYTYGDILSIYQLDNSMRTFGKQQLIWLEEALKIDKGKYKIFIVHEVATTGGAMDQSLFLFGLGDIDERNRLYRIMTEYDVGLVLSGHHHIGNIEYHMTDTLGEMNLAAYHRRKTSPIEYESDGFWYDITLNAQNGTVEIDAYNAEDSTLYKRFTFKLSSSK